MFESFPLYKEGVRQRGSLKVLLVEPQKSRRYHTPYPPLGLLKLATFHRQRGDSVKLVNGVSDNGFEADIIYITSLFTYAWEPVGCRLGDADCIASRSFTFVC